MLSKVCAQALHPCSGKSVDGGVEKKQTVLPSSFAGSPFYKPRGTLARSLKGTKAQSEPKVNELPLFRDTRDSGKEWEVKVERLAITGRPQYIHYMIVMA